MYLDFPNIHHCQYVKKIHTHTGEGDKPLWWI